MILVLIRPYENGLSDYPSWVSMQTNMIQRSTVASTKQYMDVHRSVSEFSLHASSDLLLDCASHYPAWKSEFPAAAERFKLGVFGENFVFKHMNERNVCVGDVFAIGGDALLLC